MQFKGLSRPPFVGAALLLFMVNSPMVSAQCVDTDPVGDGWGWDGSASCVIPVAATCVDTDGDGWGWDGSMTCIVSAGVPSEDPVASESESGDACVDTDGDGWGWDGSMTCIVAAEVTPETPDAAACIDTDGDGWGWDGSMSCIVSVVASDDPVVAEPESPVVAACIDTDGDGWGWDGSMTCIVSTDVASEDPVAEEDTVDPESPVVPPVAEEDAVDPEPESPVVPPVAEEDAVDPEPESPVVPPVAEEDVVDSEPDSPVVLPVAEEDTVDLEPETPVMMQCSIDPNNPPMIGLSPEGQAMREIALSISLGDTREEVIAMLGEPVAEEPISGFVGLRYTSERGSLRINNETNQLDAFSGPTMPEDTRELVNACPVDVDDLDENPADMATCHNNQACAVIPDKSYQWTNCDDFVALMTDGMQSALMGADRQRIAEVVGLPSRIQTRSDRTLWHYTNLGIVAAVSFNGQTYEAVSFVVGQCP